MVGTSMQISQVNNIDSLRILPLVLIFAGSLLFVSDEHLAEMNGKSSR